MSNLRQVKTNFTAGCIGRNLYGRGDLSIFENGARTLENVIIQPTGGVSRRKGLALIDTLPQRARLIPFEFNTEQIYLICISEGEIKIYKEGECIKTLTSPWTEAQLNSLNYTQSADTLLVVHPDVEPQQITRGDNEDWQIAKMEFYSKDGKAIYLIDKYFRASSNLAGSNIQAIRIQDGLLEEFCFETCDGFENQVSVEYTIADWYFKANLGEGWSWIFRLDTMTQDLYVPEVNDILNLTDQYTIYHFDGEYFRPKRSDGPFWIYHELRNFQELLLQLESRHHQ